MDRNISWIGNRVLDPGASRERGHNPYMPPESSLMNHTAADPSVNNPDELGLPPYTMRNAAVRQQNGTTMVAAPVSQDPSSATESIPSTLQVPSQVTQVTPSAPQVRAGGTAVAPISPQGSRGISAIPMAQGTGTATTNPAFPLAQQGGVTYDSNKFVQGPPPSTEKGYIPYYLASNIGKNMRAEFFINNSYTDKTGRLIEVGINYFVLDDVNSGTHIMCDLYSVKFITVIVGRVIPS